MAFFKWFKKNKDTKETIEEVNENIEEQEETTQEEQGEQDETDEITETEQEEIKESLEETTEEIKEDIKEILEKAETKEADIKEKIKESLEKIETEETEETKESLEETAKIIEVKEEIGESLEETTIEEIEAEEKILEIKKKEDILEPLEETEQEEEAEAESKKIGFFTKIKNGLSKTRDSILNGVDQVLCSFTKIDEELFEELEESLIMSDIGVETSVYIMEKVREMVKAERTKEVAQIKDIIVRVISNILEEETEPFSLKSPSVVLVIGVNGVGKTTTIGKLANNYKREGKKVILAAADTFRAAAIDQLQVWGDRSHIDVIKHQEGSDPAAVVFDAIKAGKARQADILICDTAGRLHNKKNLMEELKKIARVVGRENPDAQIETLLVLDATTGQNALQQAKLFSEVADITGIVLTKLDGTAKGGVVIAIKNELKIPVRFIGVGEGIEDLRLFDSKEFAKALFE